MKRRNRLLLKIRDTLIIHLGTLILNLWFKTIRVTVIGESIKKTWIEKENFPVVGAAWHRNAIFLIWYHRYLSPLIMISSSNDGALLAGFTEKLGARTVRGSSGKRGAEAFKEMVTALSDPNLTIAATVCDGPKGPPCVAKKGMAVLAMKTGLPLIPIMASYHPAITLEKTWDKTMIPKPFSKAVIMYGDPIHIPKEAGKTELESYRLKLEKRLNEMMRQCDRLTGYTTR